MQFLSLVFLGILTGVFCSKESCRHEAHFKCRVVTVIPKPLPANEGDLRKACDNLKRFEVCVSNYLSDCNPEAAEDPTGSEAEMKWEAQRIRERLKGDDKEISLMTEVCQEDSDLRARYIPDMACLREIYDMYFSQQICKNYSKTALKSLENDFDKIREETGEKYLSQPYCLQVLFDMNCFVKEFNNRCNPSSKDTAPELVQKADNIERWCPASIQSDILKLLDTWQTISDEEEIYVRGFLELV